MSTIHGEIIEHEGRRFRVSIERDENMGEPWKEHDGHGEVSAWTTRDKSPGERVLHSDGRAHLLYDYAGAIRVAKRDQWDAPPYGQGTPGQRAARAVEADIERLRGWCTGEWHWVGVVVEEVDADDEPIKGRNTALWGIESDSEAYLGEVARELAGELIELHPDAPEGELTGEDRAMIRDALDVLQPDGDEAQARRDRLLSRFSR